jgi:hypothetical protein
MVIYTLDRIRSEFYSPLFSRIQNAFVSDVVQNHSKAREYANLRNLRLIRIGGHELTTDTIITSPLQSTAGHRPLQLLVISLDLRLLASSFCQPSCANPHSTWPGGVTIHDATFT